MQTFNEHRKPKLVLKASALLGEGPIWDNRANCLWWVDSEWHLIHKTSPSTGNDTIYGSGEFVGSVALTDSGRLALARKNNLAWLDPAKGELKTFCRIEPDIESNRLADGKCDSSGRFWFGSMSTRFQNTGILYCYDPMRNRLRRMATGITIASGLGWSPNNSVMYFTDSPSRCISKFEFDTLSGRISNREILIDLCDRSPAVPAGLSIDAEGTIWSTQWNGSCLLRISPRGEILEEIPLPVRRPTSCSFGGKCNRTLFITSSSQNLGFSKSTTGISDGDLFALEVNVSRLPTYRLKDRQGR